jgi:phosphopantetheinyl transferase
MKSADCSHAGDEEPSAMSHADGVFASWPPPPPDSPSDDVALVVGVDLDRVVPDITLLDAHERQRAERRRTPDLRRTFIAAHTALRRVVGWYTGQEPQHLRWRTTPTGKPHLADDAASFNLSHSGAAALIALARSGRVGVDVEHTDRGIDLALASRLLAPAEARTFALLAPDRQPVALLRTWTRKEAVLKAIGVGLPGGMEHVVLEDDPVQLVGDFATFPHAPGLVVHDLPLPTTLVGAWCGEHSLGVPRVWRWPADPPVAR